MFKEEQRALREKIIKSLVNGEDYAITYKLSIELDELIARYYKIKDVEKQKAQKKNKRMVIII